jgi:hypothetical protein
MPVFALMLVTGCADAGGGTDGFELRTDSLGIVHAGNRGDGSWSDEEAWQIGDASFRVGAMDGAEEVTFGRISDIAVGPDGRVYVLDFQAKDVRVFDAAGAFLFRFGRPGEGPGEFSWPDGLEFTPEGDVAVRDARLFRITLFSADGDYLRDFRIQRPYPQSLGGENFWITDDGTLVDRLSLSIAVASTDSVALLRYGLNGTLHDTLLVAETRQPLVQVTRNGMPMAGVPVPFAARPIVAVAPDGRIARTTGEDYRIEILDRSGKVERIITRDAPLEPVTAAERDSLREEMRKSARELVDDGTLEEFEFPAMKPAITHLFADATGRWWVGAQRVPQRFAPPTPHPEFFDVFDPDGRYLGKVDTPFRIIEVGEDYIAGVSDDELGVSFATVAPLRKSSVPGGTR